LDENYLLVDRMWLQDTATWVRMGVKVIVALIRTCDGWCTQLRDRET